jgi:glycerophosphoryl diester phosphodiesterase
VTQTLLFVAVSLFGLMAWAQSNQQVWIVAHRGFKGIAPENTIAAFDAAAKAGARYVEVDVRATRDGHLVLMHDATVDRTTNGHGAVQDLTLARKFHR